MSGLPLKNDPETNDGIGFVFLDELAGQIRNLKGSGRMNDLRL